MNEAFRAGKLHNPNDLRYKAVSSRLLSEMRVLSSTAMNEMGEIIETWPSELRIVPVTPLVAEGVLYMAKYSCPVYLFQAVGRVPEGLDYRDAGEADIDVKVTATPFMTPSLLKYANEAHMRASEYRYVCVCGHVMPEISAICDTLTDGEDPLDGLSMTSNMAESLSEYICDNEDDAEFINDVRESIENAIRKSEESYKCPACGYMPFLRGR